MFFGLFETEFPFVVFTSLLPLALLFLRIMLAVMFIDSGRRHLSDPKGRAESLGLSVPLVILTGVLNVTGGILVLLGWFTYLGAFILSGVMIGAICLKLFVWKTGIYGKNNDGCYYDALLLAGAGILFSIGAGPLSVDALL